MIKITDEDFSIDKIITGMRNPKVGGIITYLGTVRRYSGGREVDRMEFNSSKAAVSKIREVEERVLEDFDVEDVAIIHRVGQLKVGEKILLVAVSAAHRQPAFNACMSIIDKIKEIHSSWAREVLLS